MNHVAKMPTAFIGHDSPMNTLEHNRFTAAWRELGQALPRPRCVGDLRALVHQWQRGDGDAKAARHS